MIVTGLYRTLQVAQLSQRDRAVGWVSYGQKWKIGLGDNIYGGLYSTTATYMARKKAKSAIKSQIRAITPFKVIQGHRGRYQSKACDFLLVINSNWRPISYRFGDIAAYCSNFGHFAFFEPPFGGLETTYDVHIGLIEKRVADFLLVLIELFSLGRTAEALRTKIDRKSAISLQRGHFDPKFQVEGDVPNNNFCMDS